jgi:ammonia channel protein AmtB
MLAVLGVVAFYMIYFIAHIGHSAESIALLLFYSILLALPMVLFLTPLFIMYFVGSARREKFTSSAFIYFVIVICMIIQYLWLGLLTTESHGG